MSFPVKRVTLTSIVAPVLRSMKSGKLTKALVKFGLTKKWEATPFAQRKINQIKRSNLNDFERFKVMILRKKVLTPIHPLTRLLRSPY